MRIRFSASKYVSMSCVATSCLLLAINHWCSKTAGSHILLKNAAAIPLALFTGTSSDSILMHTTHNTQNLRAVDVADSECKSLMKDPNRSSYFSQYGQDWFVYNNFFTGKHTGFYIDIGANDPVINSNTYFFDKCLGWSGICVDASAEKAAQLAKQRTCVVVNKCIADVRKVVQFSHDGSPTAQVGSGSGVVECITINDILSTYNVTQFDYLSLDIEGSELQALSSASFDGIRAGVLTVETFWSNQGVSHTLYDKGFVKLTDLGPDDVFVPREGTITLPPLAKYWRETVAEARDAVQKDQGKCIDSNEQLRPV